MPIINNPFNGKLNLDVAEYRISNGDYIDALNITKDAQGRGQDRVVSNIVGNTLIPYTLTSGTNKIIGFYADKIRNRAYYFLWNSNGYNSILYYSLSNDTITKVLESKTDSDGIDILNFDPSYKVLSVNIIYRDNEGDILFFNDGYNPPKNINVISSYGTNWKYEYLLVAKAPPIMPPRVTYENDINVKVNNLRNKLFQFSYRYVYVNNEKSVWSSKSIVPLPQQETLLLTEPDASNNSRISVSVSTGGLDVKAIEVSFRETTSGVTSDWYLINSFNKSNLSINNDSIYTFNFYNDSIYVQLDVIETSQLQDWVPQKANASELANGNTLLYSGITEGYDKTKMNLYASSGREVDSYFFDKCGLLFFASCNGNDSGITGTNLNIYLYGGNGESLNNARGIYVINAVNSSNSNIGISYELDSDSVVITTLLDSIKSSLISNGWSFVYSGSNVLTMSYAGGFTLYSSGVKYLYNISEPVNTVFANSWQAGYQYGIQYFDSVGRTIGTQVSKLSSFTTPTSTTYNGVTNVEYNYPYTYLEIQNRPPLEAAYYQVVRSNNTTYNKRLFWVSLAAYSSAPDITTTQRFAYIDVANIEDYNKSISSTQGVVSYSFTEGDRITFLNRFNKENVKQTFVVPYDYQILGTVSTIVLSDNTTKVGNFIKILYPTDDIGANLNFDGSPDYLHYEIFLYNLSNNASVNQRFFYEFGKCFGIGNPGTNLAYHIGLEQTQSATDPNNVPAIVSATNGDLFFRKRKVPYNDNYVFASGPQNQEINSLLSIVVPNSPINTTTYIVKTQPLLTNLPGNFPTFSSTNFFFENLLTTENQTVKLNGEFSVYQSEPNNNTTFSFQAILINSTTTTYVPLTATHIVQSNVQSSFVLDSAFTVTPLTKVWIAVYCDNVGSTESFTVNAFNLNFSVLKSATINIIESSFNDTYNLVTNSNGRPSVVDENAAQVYYPVLIRFGQEFQANTNINNVNRFYPENLDEYDRSFGDVMRLHVRDRYLKVYQKFKVGNVPILTQIIKDSANNPLQANTDKLINKIQYYAGDYGIGDASTSLAWNNFSDYFVDNYRGVVCRLSQDGITPLSLLYNTNAFFVPTLYQYRQSLNNGVVPEGQVYTGNPCIYGVFDAYTNKYIIAMEEINRYTPDCEYNGGSAKVDLSNLCIFNGGSAIKSATSDCTLIAGSVLTGNCTLTPGSVIVLT
jgi:hypothetical protein